MSVLFLPVEPENDALSLEYKLVEGCASGDAHLTDFVNNPVAQGIVWISGHGSSEELFDFSQRQRRPVVNDRGDFVLVGEDAV